MLFHENLGQTGFHRWICPEFERDKKSVPIAAEKAVNKLMLRGFELCFFDYPTPERNAFSLRLRACKIGPNGVLDFHIPMPLHPFYEVQLEVISKCVFFSIKWVESQLGFVLRPCT
jgi:hypothetical protein